MFASRPTMTSAGVIPAATMSSISMCTPQPTLLSVPKPIRTPSELSLARLAAWMANGSRGLSRLKARADVPVLASSSIRSNASGG